MKISLLINMKMPTIIGIFIFISRETFMPSRVEHENSFTSSGPGAVNGVSAFGDTSAKYPIILKSAMVLRGHFER